MIKFSVDSDIEIKEKKIDRANGKYGSIKNLLTTNESDYEIIKKLNISNYEDLEDYIIFQYCIGNKLCGAAAVATCLMVILQKYGVEKTIEYIKELPNKWFMKERGIPLMYKEVFIFLDCGIYGFDDISDINSIINKYINSIINKYINLIFNGVKKDYIFEMLYCYYRKTKNFMQVEPELAGYFIAEELLSSEEMKLKIKVLEENN